MSKYATESPTRVALDLTERVHVLHVDDDQSLLSVTKQCLETEGAIQVDSVLSADEALARLENEKYDVLISDYQMPGKDGLQLLKELRQKGETIPFVMFTGKGREEVAIQALNLGANQYVNKVGDAQTVYTELTHSIRELARIKKAEEEARRAKESLNHSEQNYRELFDNATDTLLTLDLNGNITTINNAVLRWGFRKEDILGRNLLEFVSEDSQSIIAKDSFETFHGKSVRNEAEIETPKGKIAAEYRASPMVREGRIIGAQIALRDITERKKTERTLNRLAIAVDRTVDGIAIADINGIIQFVNPAWAQMHGYKTSELLGKHLSVFHTEDQMKRDVIPFNEKVLKNGSNQGEVGHVKKDGTIFPTLMTTTLLKDEDGSPSGFVGTAKDATESQKAKETLKESEERFRNLFEKANDGLVFVDFDGRIIDIN